MPSEQRLSYPFNPGVTYPLYLIRRRLLQTIRPMAARFKGRVLDFGCGIKPYRSLFSVDEYIGVDYAGEGETYAKDQADFLYDGRHLPFADNHFDAIFTTEVVEHIFNLEEIVPELWRVLKPGGELLLTCPFAMPEHEIPADYARYTSFALRHLFERNGFTVLTFEKTGNFVEALAQLRIIWVDQVLIRRVRRIPVVRSLLRTVLFGFLNLKALLWSKLFGKNKTLYLNNVILLQKKGV